MPIATRRPPTPATRSLVRVTVLALGLLLWRAVTPLAHEVPSNVVVRAFVKPEGQRLRVLVRVPLEAMRDVEFPFRAVTSAMARAPSEASAGAATAAGVNGIQWLDLARADSTLRDAAQLWVADAITLYADNIKLDAPTIAGVRAALPSNRAFASYETALAEFSAAPLPASTELPWTQALLDVMLEYTITRDDATFAMTPALAHLGVRTTTVLHFVPRGGGDERVLTYDGDPGLVRLDPSWWQSATRFVALGFAHILDGIDHLLFLLCLVIPFRKARPVIALVTAFTVAHSITLVASAAGYAPDALWFPPLVEVLIALSIVYMACENIVGARIERRWPLAFAFGLVHGFGFSFALRDTLQFAGTHLAVSLAAFNVGVELGQLAVLAVALPVLHALFTRVMPERIGTVLLSAIVGHSAWHWMSERFAELRTYRITWPMVDALFIADVMRALAIALALGGLTWAVSGRVGRWLTPTRRNAAAALFAAALALVGAPREASAQPKAQRMRSTVSGVFTAEQAAGGKEVFLGACTGCHTSASHTGTLFTSKWAGRPLAELYAYVSERMPKATPGSLSEDEYVLVVAYVLKLNGMPAGKSELSADPAVLNAIRFDTSAADGNDQRRGAPVERTSGSQRLQDRKQYLQVQRIHAGPTRNAMEQR